MPIGSAFPLKNLPIRKEPSAVAGSVPFDEGAEAGTDGDCRSETVVAVQRFGIGVGDWDIAGLHANILAVGFEVVVLWENAGADQLFL